MKRFLICLSIFLFCTCTCFAVANNIKALERSGCCSHHGGVCGCANGRAVCCDGSYSPSCGCY